MGGRSRTARCSRCGVQLVVPPSARTIRCALCRGITNVGPRQDPVRQAVGFVKSMVNSLNPLFSYGSGGSSMSYGSNENYSPWNLPSSYPPVQGKKRALLIGVSYTRRRYELKGTVNDVNCMRFLLCERFGFPRECILVLTGMEIVAGSVRAAYVLITAIGFRDGSSLHAVEVYVATLHEPCVKSKPINKFNSCRVVSQYCYLGRMYTAPSVDPCY